MKSRDNRSELAVVQGAGCVTTCCDRTKTESELAVSRRRFLQGMGAAGVAVGGLALAAAESRAASADPVPGEPFPRGKALRLKPILVHDLPDRTASRTPEGRKC